MLPCCSSHNFYFLMAFPLVIKMKSCFISLFFMHVFHNFLNYISLWYSVKFSHPKVSQKWER